MDLHHRDAGGSDENLITYAAVSVQTSQPVLDGSAVYETFTGPDFDTLDVNGIVDRNLFFERGALNTLIVASHITLRHIDVHKYAVQKLKEQEL